MIDIHNHLLYGLDDGPLDEESMLELAREAEKIGITDIVATPHYIKHRFRNNADIVKSRTEEVQSLLNDHHIDIKVYPSQEIHMFGEELEGLECGELLPITEGSRYVLIEFPFFSIPEFAEQTFEKLFNAGYRPILAHPERIIPIQDDPQILFDLIDRGALCQVTAGSLVNKYGEDAKRVADYLLEQDAIHIVGSDAHNTTNRNFHIKEAYEFLERTKGIETVTRFKENARKILKNEEI
ncbi:tyrosine-protein phosphatase [Mammaliicoccus sciuri]|uniref:tyrosine-protein phosphatase n=1 Tax=Mammaliicoccus sciuri TaxID=1296 RepID=UPI002737F8F5|nr:CpsB/CapC family capsule biosynthesis tyrosine phosphatase [Mammaliicoccus sciuri]